MTVTRRTVWFTMLDPPFKGRVRVGNAFGSRADAVSWIPFVRSYWNGLRVSVAQCTLMLEDGVLTERSKHLLDQKFNLEPMKATP